MNNIRNINKINELELSRGLVGEQSWHEEYKDSSYIFFGGIPFDLTEGDVITVFSQYGEVVNIEIIRDFKTGKSKGFGFLAYEDQRSTVLAVDNLNGIKLLDRTIRVDHVKDYENKRREREDYDEDKERERLRKILPDRLLPENLLNRNEESSPSIEDSLVEDPDELDPMRNYILHRAKKSHKDVHKSRSCRDKDKSRSCRDKDKSRRYRDKDKSRRYRDKDQNRSCRDKDQSKSCREEDHRNDDINDNSHKSR